MRSKPKVVIDTNIFINSWFDNIESCNKVVDLAFNHKVKLLFSQSMIGELMYITKKYAIKNISNNNSRELILQNVSDMFLYSKSIDTTDMSCPVIKDKYDEMFLKCALKGEANYIISNDFRSGMHELKDIGVKVVGSKEFINVIDNINVAVNQLFFDNNFK
jgi:putative PIN family toxin of toxin-antitoxin system